MGRKNISAIVKPKRMLNHSQPCASGTKIIIALVFLIVVVVVLKVLHNIIGSSTMIPSQIVYPTGSESVHQMVGMSKENSSCEGGGKFFFVWQFELKKIAFNSDIDEMNIKVFVKSFKYRNMNIFLT